MSTVRAATLLGLLGGGVATFVGLVLILAAGIGLLILPWAIATLISGATVALSPARALKYARIAAIWAAFSTLIFMAIIATSFDVGLFGVLVFWLAVSLPVPVGQWVLTRRVVASRQTTTARISS